MTSDHEELIAQLRDWPKTSLNLGEGAERLTLEAADALSKQGEENRRLREALAKIAEGITPPHQNGHYLAHRNAVTIARAALHPKGSGGEEQGLSRDQSHTHNAASASGLTDQQRGGTEQ